MSRHIFWFLMTVALLNHLPRPLMETLAEAPALIGWPAAFYIGFLIARACSYCAAIEEGSLRPGQRTWLDLIMLRGVT